MFSMVVSAIPVASASEFELTLESGSVIRTEVPTESLNWTEVLDNGDLRSEKIPLAQIDRLVLSEMPASQKVSEVRKTLEQLNSDDFWQREEAQQRLSDRDFGGPFRTLIETFADSPSAEVRYRVERVLSELGEYAQQGPTEFDLVVLKSGRELKGDAGQFQWPVRADGHSLAVNRSQLRMVRSPRVWPVSELRPAMDFDVEIIRQPDGKLLLPEQTIIDFEDDTHGNPLSRKAVVSDTWLAEGIRFLTPVEGHIAISGYGFKFPETPTGRNSACVFIFNKARQTYDRFRGTVMVEFCVPGQPNVPAGVNEFGVYVARINHERDFILEAFNAAGQIIATVEAGQRDCALLALKSNQLITRVRVRSNPYLHQLSRKIDEDFAIDTVCFSTPIPVSARPSRSLAVQLNNGNRWAASSVKLANDRAVSFRSSDLNRDISLPFEQIRQVDLTGGNQMTLKNLLKPGSGGSNAGSGTWKVRLKDGSVLNVRAGRRMATLLQSGIEFDPEDFSALWHSSESLRLPTPGDFDDASTVVVFPTGRVTTDRMKFDSRSSSWQTKEKRLQPVATDNSDADSAADLIPDINSIQYAKAGDAKLGTVPSIWQQPPQSIPDSAGLVRTVDGQMMVLGQSGMFELDDVNQRILTLLYKPSGDKVEVKIENLQSIRFPAVN